MEQELMFNAPDCEQCGEWDWKVIRNYYDEFDIVDGQILQCESCQHEITVEFDG